MPEISCVITNVRFKAEDTGYAVLVVERPDQFESITAVGTMPDAEKGMAVTMIGDWVTHPKFGKQFRFDVYEIPLPTDAEGAVSYLATLKGLKGALAQRVYDYFGDTIYEVLDERPEELINVKGIGAKILPKIIESYNLTKGMRNLIGFLHELGVSASYAKRIYDKFGQNSIAEIKADPYILSSTVKGFGFKKADELARGLGIKPDAKVRTRAGVMHTLRTATNQQGHCFLPLDELAPKTCELLVLPGYTPVINDIEIAVKDLTLGKYPELRTEALGDMIIVYPYKLWIAEAELADFIKQGAGEFENPPDITNWLSQYEKSNSVAMADGQRKAVEMVAANKIAVITGGPGVGKLQPYEEPVLTPQGWQTMRDIVPGSYVIAKDGTATQVISVYPGKNLEIYRVNFDDGTWTECCIDHLWEVQSRKQRDTGKYSVMTLSEMLPKINNPGKKPGYYYSIDRCQPVEFLPPAEDHVIHPYLLGWILGDGYIPEKQSAMTIAVWNKDVDEVIGKLSPILPEGVTITSHGPFPSSPNVVYLHLIGGIRKHLKELGLIGVKSKDKFVPDNYLYSDVTSRKFLLSGLLDTDGSASSLSANNKKVRFSSYSQVLAENVIELCLSLGGRASLHVSDRKEKGVEYSVSINMPFNPFILSRKQKLMEGRIHSHKYRKRIVSATYVGQKDGQCILVDHPTHTYITRGYTVTHNTTVSKAVVGMWHSQNKRIIGCAPSGKAARRLKETTGLKSSTIHRLLGWTGTGFAHTRDNPLPGDAFLIDEFSMVDLKLAHALFEAIPRHASVVMVGDVDQLPSVGPGNVLRDIINSGSIPVTRLTQIFRQAATSKIISTAHQINHGEFPEFELFGKANLNPYSDALWIKCDRGLIPRAIQWLIDFKLFEMGWEKDSIQCLSPMHKGDIGNIELNKMIQGFWNPPESKKAELKGFRVGDRVIQTVNNYDKEIFNGDIGKIASIDKKNGEAIVLFPDDNSDEGRPVELDESDFNDLNLAYSMSVHKCIRASERVSTINRGLVPISDIEVGDLVLTGTGAAKPVTGKFYSGKKQVVRITTRCGYHIDVSKEHPILVSKNGELPKFILASELVWGDFAYISKQSSQSLEFNLPKLVGLNDPNPEDLALFLGKFTANRTKDDSIVVPNSEDYDFIQFFMNSLGIEVLEKQSNKVELYWSSEIFSDWLSELGVGTSNIPYVIWSAPFSIRVAFLKGLFGNMLKFYSSSSALINEVRNLLLSVGIVSYIENGVIYTTELNAEFNPPISSPRLIDTPKPKETTADNNYFYDQIVSIDYLDESDDMYDIEVEGIHSFVSNGFVCHNSQGSEFPVIIIPMSMSQYIMLQRNLLYTGVTRGKKLVVLVGEEEAIKTAVRTNKIGKRNTLLKSRLAN